MFQNNSNRESLSKLAQQNYNLYEQLKNRQLEYINLIKDLHQENYRLRMILTNSTNKNNIQKQETDNPCKTPSFTSMNNSGSGMLEQEQQIIKKNKQNSTRFSFADKLSDSVKEQSPNVKIQIQNNQPKNKKVFFVNVASQYYRNQPHNTNMKLSLNSTTQERIPQQNNSINNPTDKFNKKQQAPIIQTPKNLRQVSKSQLWAITTNKSLNRQSRNSSTQGIDYIHDDNISQTSQIDNFHQKFTHSPQKFKEYLNKYSKIANPQYNEESQVRINTIRTITEEISQQNRIIKEKQQQNTCYSSPRNRYDNSISSIHSFSQASSPRNRFKINNKIYL